LLPGGPCLAHALLVVDDLGGGEAAGVSRRKRKKREDSEDDESVPSEKNTIKSIIAKRLWSTDRDEVANVMLMLYNLFHKSNINSIENRTFAFQLGAPLAIAKAMSGQCKFPRNPGKRTWRSCGTLRQLR
jgi:hypothetical protein